LILRKSAACGDCPVANQGRTFASMAIPEDIFTSCISAATRH